MRPTTILPRFGGKVLRRVGLIIIALWVACAAALPARAQSGQLVLISDEIVYDYDANVISAVGNVQMEYLQLVVTADRITYYQATGRLVAVGNVVIVDASGIEFTAEMADVTEDFGEGFIEQLYVVTPDRTFFSAETAERHSGEVTEFYNATYTACEVTPDHENLPPFWQVRAAKIVHDGEEEMVYFEHARFEVLGVPVAYTPRLSTPDPAVSRKTGFLRPDYGASTTLGYHVSLPFFWAPARNFDLTLTPTYFTKAGLLAEAEWRHRLASGMYTISAAGIYQKAMPPTPRMFRGAVRTTGDFNINRFWQFGWDATIQTDRGFTNTYNTVHTGSPFLTNEGYVTGVVDQTYLDAHVYYFQNVRTGGAPRDNQARQAIVYPVVDFEKTFDMPILGGELRYSANLTNLSRGETDPFNVGADTYYYGLAGNYTRLTQEISWRKRIIGPMGQVITPFAFGRADLYLLDLIAPPPGVTTDSFVARFTGGAGVEWSWPFLIQTENSSHVIEPVVQLVARPSETMIGALPNEDSQSVILDTTTLLSLNRFTGFDRIEGGTRLTAALRYSGQFGGASLEAMLGQSFQLAGVNSYAMPGVNSIGMGTGLETPVSHIVAAVGLSSEHVSLNATGRFDPSTFEIQRAIVSASTEFDRFNASIGLAYERSILDLGGSPETAFHITSRAELQVAEKWTVGGSIDYDAVLGAVVADSITLRYECSCVAFGVTYSEKRAPGVVLDRSIKFSLQLRTLGDFNIGG